MMLQTLGFGDVMFDLPMNDGKWTIENFQLSDLSSIQKWRTDAFAQTFEMLACSTEAMQRRQVQEALPRRVLTTPPGDPPTSLTFGPRSRGWVQNPKQEEGWRVQVAPPGNMRAAPLGGVRVAPRERVRVAPLKLDRPIVRVLEDPYDGRVVTVPGLMSTIHEL